MSFSKVFRIVSVNKFPDRAAKIIGRVTQELKETYTLNHVANCADASQVSVAISANKPDVVFCASVWTPEEQEKILDTAHKMNIKTFSTPTGLHAQKGEDGVVEYIKNTLPSLLEEIEKNRT